MRPVQSHAVLIALSKAALAGEKMDANTSKRIKSMQASRKAIFQLQDFESETLIIRKKIEFGGTVNLLDANTKKLVGVSSFNEQKLERPTFIDRLKVTYGAYATADDPGIANVKYDTAIPAQLLNAQLIISQDGKVQQSHLISTLIERGDVKTDDTYAQVLTFTLSNADNNTEIDIKFPQGATASAADVNYISVEMGGVAYRS